MSELVVVRAFSHPHEAQLACSALQAAGIDATVADAHTVAANGLYSKAVRDYCYCSWQPHPRRDGSSAWHCVMPHWLVVASVKIRW